MGFKGLKDYFKLQKDSSRIPNAVQSETIHCSIGELSGMAFIVPPYHWIGRNYASFPIEEQNVPPKIITPRYINLCSTSAQRLGLRRTSCHSSQCETRQPLSRLATHSTARRLENRKREKESAQDTADVMREACRITQWKWRRAEGLFFSCKPVFVSRKQIWVFAPCGWVITSRRFETSRHHLRGYESVSSLITVKMAAELFLETSGINYPTKMRNNSEDFDPQQSLGGNLK